MRAIIYYFTGTRNTLMVCEKYVQAFADKGVQCDLHPMNKFKDIPSPNDYELVGLPIPFTASTPPTSSTDLCGGCRRCRTRSIS